MSQPKRCCSAALMLGRRGIAVLLGLCLSLLWLWACFGTSGDDPATSPSSVLSGGSIPTSSGNREPSAVMFQPTALLAFRPATSETIPNAAPAVPVATTDLPQVLDWARLPVAIFPERTAKELEASLAESSAVVDLYDKRYSKANSYGSITREMDLAREQLVSTIRQQRESCLRVLDDDPQHKTIADGYRKALERRRYSIEATRKFEGPYDQRIAALAAKSANGKQSATVHRLSPHYVAVREWSNHRLDLAGLPFLDFERCELEYPPAATLRDHSRVFRALNRRSGRDIRTHLQQTRWETEDVPALVQILQVQPEEVRLELIAVLFRISGPESTVALARRALFDYSSAVRDKAISALATRSPDVFRPILLEGLRYPWGPVTDHAANVLVGVNDVQAIPDLERLLTKPNPRLPFRNSHGQWAVRELVRVNHMRNCYLCHAPSLSEYDTVRGFVPSPSQSLPRLYYASRSRGGHFVRADVTYLRQDFSVMHAVKNHKPWPERQRFDYLVRTRLISKAEAVKIRKRLPKWDAQRNAVLVALHQLAAGPGKMPLRAETRQGG